MSLWNRLLVWFSLKYFSMGLGPRSVRPVRRAAVVGARVSREFLRCPRVAGVPSFAQSRQRYGMRRLGQEFYTDLTEAVFGVRHLLFPNVL